MEAEAVNFELGLLNYTIEEQGEMDRWVVSALLTDAECMKNQLNVLPERPGGGRFKCLNTKQLEELEEKRQSKSTKRNTQWGLKIIQGKQPFIEINYVHIIILDTLSNIQNNTKQVSLTGTRTQDLSVN